MLMMLAQNLNQILMPAFARINHLEKSHRQFTQYFNLIQSILVIRTQATERMNNFFRNYIAYSIIVLHQEKTVIATVIE